MTNRIEIAKCTFNNIKHTPFQWNIKEGETEACQCPFNTAVWNENTDLSKKKKKKDGV